MTWTLHIQDGEHRILLGEYTTEELAAYARRYAANGLRYADADPDVTVVMEEVKPSLPTEVGSVVWITKAGDNPQSPPIKAMRRDNYLPWVLSRPTRNGNLVLTDAQVTGWEPWTP